MTLDTYTLTVFGAGVLTGVGLVVLGRVAAHVPKVIEDIRRYRRSHRRPPAEPRPLDGGRR